MTRRVLVPLTRLQWTEPTEAPVEPEGFAELRDSWNPPRDLLAGTEAHPNLEIDREAEMYLRSRLRGSLSFLTWLMLRWPEAKQ